MELIIDIGNTNVVIGFYQNSTWIHLLRFITKKDGEAKTFYDVKLRESMLDLEFEIETSTQSYKANQ